MEAHCFYRCEDRASACGPKAAQRRAPGRVGLGRVLPEHGEEKALTGGACASATERDMRGWQFGPGTGPAEVGCVGEKERKEGRDRGWVGPEKENRASLG